MTGWTWEYIAEHMTLPRFNALLEYWDECPPAAESANEIRTMMRSYFGIEDRRRTAAPEEMTEEVFAEQGRMLGELFG